MNYISLVVSGTLYREAGRGVGPDLSRIAIVATTRKPPLTAEQYIRESIESPAAFTVPVFGPDVMPNGLRGQMSEEEFEALGGLPADFPVRADWGRSSSPGPCLRPHKA